MVTVTVAASPRYGPKSTNMKGGGVNYLVSYSYEEGGNTYEEVVSETTLEYMKEDREAIILKVEPTDESITQE